MRAPKITERHLWAAEALLLASAAAGDVAAAHGAHLAQGLIFGLVLLGGVVVLLILNFALFAVDLMVKEGRSFARLWGELFVPTLSGELAVGVIAVILVLAYRSVG